MPSTILCRWCGVEIIGTKDAKGTGEAGEFLHSLCFIKFMDLNNNVHTNGWILFNELWKCHKKLIGENERRCQDETHT